MIVSKGNTIVWTGTPATWGTWPASLPLGKQWASYAQIYKRQTWVRICVDKRALLLAQLPLKVYEHDALNRPEAVDSPYARLLATPNRRHSRFFFWLWMQSTSDIYGEAFMGKIRDAGGRPVELVPLHPTSMRPVDEKDGRVIWDFDNGKVHIHGIPDEDLVHLRNYNPDTFNRGLSKLESLRSTLENEDAALRAQSSFWRNGARPGVALSHPGVLTPKAAARLKLSWDAVTAGADNTGVTVVLEEGMKPELLQVTNDEAQYIESRKLNREEIVAAFDMPPPAVHLLDHATFSNITEQLRSIYRDSMAPVTISHEAELETQLRGSVRPGASEPDFSPDEYAEFLLDGVLRGDFEQRAEAYQKAINSGWTTPAEVRRLENLPFIEGSDRLFINSTMVPVSPVDDDEKSQARFGDVGIAVQRLGLGVNYGVLSAEEARALLPGIDGPAPSQEQLRMLMGRLARPKTLEDIEPGPLVEGLNGEGRVVLAALGAAKEAGLDVPGFREFLRALSTKETS